MRAANALRVNSGRSCSKARIFFLGSFLGSFLGGSPQVLMGSVTYGNCKVVRDIPLPQSYGPAPVPAHSLI